MNGKYSLLIRDESHKVKGIGTTIFREAPSGPFKLVASTPIEPGPKN